MPFVTSRPLVNSVLGRPYLGIARLFPLFSGEHRDFSDTCLSRSGAFSLKLPSPSVTMFPRPLPPSFFLALQSPAPLELVSSSHHAPIPRQDATSLARPVHHHASIWTLSIRSESIYAHSYAAWSTVSRLLRSVSPGCTATSRRVGSLSSLKAESVVTQNLVPLLSRLMAPAAIASTRSVLGLHLTSQPLE